MRIVVLLVPVLLSACGSTSPTEPQPRDHFELVARLITPAGGAVEGARAIIKTWPAADGQTDDTFTGFLTSGADGVVHRTAGPFTGGKVDSVEVYATPPGSCSWNPVRTMVRAIALDTLPAGRVEVVVQLPDTLGLAQTELGVLCAQGTELPSVPGLLSYDLYLDVREFNGSTITGKWALQSTFYGWADGTLSATIANGVVGMLLTPTDGHPLCGEIRLLGTVEPGGSWSRMEVVTDVVVPGWPCVPAGHRYRFFKSTLSELP